MSHFLDSDWVDFARGLKSPSEERAMEEHLRAGCRRCERIAGIWRAAVETARRELPPSAGAGETALRRMYREWRDAVPEAPILGALISDSLFQPALSGVRSAAAPARRLLYRAQNWLVDLQLLPAGAGEVTILGQVSADGKEAPPLESGRVQLELDGNRSGEVALSPLGEFEISFRLAGEARLWIYLPAARAIGLDLPCSDSAA